MHRTGFLVLMIVGLSVFTDGQVNRTRVATNDAPSRLEYEIYAVVAKEWFGGKEFKIFSALREVSSCEDVTKYVDPLQAKIPDLKMGQITADCLGKSAARLDALELNLQKKVALLSRKDMKRLFATDCEMGWKTFYKQYPKSTGQVTFSRVGFDDDGKFAALNFGFKRECLFGEGHAVFLQKLDGVWRIIYKQSTWV